MNGMKLILGDALEKLKELPDESIDCCITSPPYYGLRSYLPDKVQLREDLTGEEIKTLKKELTLLGLKVLRIKN